MYANKRPVKWRFDLRRSRAGHFALVYVKLGDLTFLAHRTETFRDSAQCIPHKGWVTVSGKARARRAARNVLRALRDQYQSSSYQDAA